MAYEPTEWQCGDVITADKLNKLEQAVADFECGSSDFSTAEVTIISGNLSQENNLSLMPIVALDEVDVNVWTEVEVLPNSTQTSKILLYKGASHEVMVYNFDRETLYDVTKVSVTGDASIEIDGEDWWLEITGDCTITIS